MLLADGDALRVLVLGVALGQGEGRLHGVADLAAVPPEGAHLAAVPDELAGGAGDVDEAAGVPGEAVKVVRPDALPVLVAEAPVVQGDVDAAEERVVERLDAVRGEEEDAAVVLEGAQEDGDEAVAGNVLGPTALEVDVGLVEEDEGAVALTELEEVAQVGLDVVRVNAEVAAGEGDQGSVGQLGDALCGAGLADAGGAVEEEDAALALVLDEVVAPGRYLAGAEVGCELADQGLDGQLDLVIENKVLEGLLVSVELLQVGEVEVAPAAIAEDEAWDGVAADQIEEVAVRRRVVSWVEVIKAKVRAVVALARTVRRTSLASASRLVPGQMILGRRGSLIVARRGVVAGHSAHGIGTEVVEAVKAGCVTDDTTSHEARRSPGLSVGRPRVDELTLVVHVRGTLQELPVQLTEGNVLLPHGQPTLSLEVLGPELGRDDGEAADGLLAEPGREAEAVHVAVDLGAIGLEHPAADLVRVGGSVGVLVDVDAADDVGGPDAVTLCVDDLAGLEEKPEVLKGGPGNIEVVALLLQTDLLAEVVVEEPEKGVNVTDGGGGILGVVSRRLVVSITGQLLAVVVENAVGRADCDELAVEVDVGVVRHDGLEGVDQMLGVDAHEGPGNVWRRGLEILLILRVVVIITVVDLVECLGDGPVFLTGTTTRGATTRPPAGCLLSEDLCDDLKNGLLLCAALFLVFDIAVGIVLELGNILEGLSALASCKFVSIDVL